MALTLLLSLADAALKLALPAVIAWVGTLGAKWINGKANSEKLSSAFLRLLDVVNTTVAEVQQTLVGGLKADAADGKISAGEMAARLADAKKVAVDKVLQYLGPEYQKLLTEGFKINGDTLRQFIAARIEAAVLNLKSPGSTNVPAFLQGPGVQAPVQPLPAFLAMPAAPVPAVPDIPATPSGARVEVAP
jgi:hypothetical protein